MFLRIKSAVELEWQDYILVYPAISVGGVGQLAIDLILSNIQDAERIGFLYSKCFFPVVGSDPFDGIKSKTICTSCEVFVSKSRQLIIVQQRSPFIKGQIPCFRRQLVDWVKQCNFRKVIVLGSCSSHVQNDSELNMSSHSVMYLSSDDNHSLENLFCKELKWTKFKHTRELFVNTELREELFIPGGGITTTLFNDCCNDNISVIALLVFSSDGNGTPDAFALVDGFNSLLPLMSTVKPFKAGSWKMPESWNRSVCTAAVQQMY